MERILLIDDNPMTLKKLEALLAKPGREVLKFTGAEPALQLLVQHPASLIVLDLAMPVHSGYDLMKTLRSIEVRIPILVVSGKNNPEDITKAMGLGANDYLLKPFDDDLFIAKVEGLLKNKTGGFAEAFVQEAVTLGLQIPSFTISELGFQFHTQFAVPKGTLIKFESGTLANLGITETEFRVAHCTADIKNPDTFKVFVSFVGMSPSLLADVRAWAQKNQLKFRRPA
jgi:DNA-binding response OmpR family regulator